MSILDLVRSRWWVLLAVHLAMPTAVGADSDVSSWARVDRIVAKLGDVPVMQSDVQLEQDFGLLEAGDREDAFEELLQAYLNRLLILREVEDIGGFRLTSGQVESAYLGYVAGYGDRSEYDEKLERWGIYEVEIYNRLGRALLASLYTESRIQFVVKVLPSDIEKAYDEDPERWGGRSLYEAWETIKSQLTDEMFRAEKKRWLSTLAERYRVVRIGGAGVETR